MRKYSLSFFILSLMTILFLSGCNLFNTVTIDERIDQFITDCDSSDKSSMYLNLHPTETVARSQMQDPSTWVTFSDTHKPWSITEISRSGSTEVTMIATIDNNTIDPAENITIVFKEGESGVWYIKSFIWIDASINIQ